MKSSTLCPLTSTDSSLPLSSIHNFVSDQTKQFSDYSFFGGGLIDNLHSSNFFYFKIQFHLLYVDSIRSSLN